MLQYDGTQSNCVDYLNRISSGRGKDYLKLKQLMIKMSLRLLKKMTAAS